MDIVNVPKHGADLLCRGQLYLCYVCLNIDREYRVLESVPTLRFKHLTSTEYSRHSCIALSNHVCVGHLVSGLSKCSSYIILVELHSVFSLFNLKELGRACLGAFVQGPTVS